MRIPAGLPIRLPEPRQRDGDGHRGHRRAGHRLGTFGGGWMLAWLYKRLHPSLSFYKLWAFWSMVLGAIVALLFALGAVRM